MSIIWIERLTSDDLYCLWLQIACMWIDLCICYYSRPSWNKEQQKTYYEFTLDI